MTQTETPRTSREQGADDRAGLVIITSELTPYRVHFHRRVAREIPDLRLWTLLTRDTAWSSWKLGEIPEINVVALGEGTLKGTRSAAGRARLQWRLASRTARWLDSHRVSAVLVNGYDELSRLRAIHWGNRRGVPVLLWGDSNIRCDRPVGWRRAAKGAIVPAVLRHCSALLACGSLGRAFFRRYGVPDDRIFYSPVEPDYEQLERLDPAVQAEANSRFRLQPERRRFVISSRLVEHKRVDLAIDAFVALAHDLADWDLVILGGGPLESALRARVPSGLQPRVLFTGFIGEQQLVTAVYRASHVLVHPANFEPWALVINEAAAAGLAIVCSDVVGAAAELVRDGVNGFVVPADDGPALQAAMRRAADPARLPAMREASVEVLRRWRQTADPVEGLRRALSSVGALRPSTRP